MGKRIGFPFHYWIANVSVYGKRGKTNVRSGSTLFSPFLRNTTKSICLLPPLEMRWGGKYSWKTRKKRNKILSRSSARECEREKSNGKKQLHIWAKGNETSFPPISGDKFLFKNWLGSLVLSASLSCTMHKYFPIFPLKLTGGLQGYFG